MSKLINIKLFAALVVLASMTGGVRPASAGLFCDLCKIQGCSCSGSQCTNCGSLTATPGQSGNEKAVISRQRDLSITRKVCLRVQGRFIKTRCSDMKVQ